MDRMQEFAQHAAQVVPHAPSPVVLFLLSHAAQDIIILLPQFVPPVGQIAQFAQARPHALHAMLGITLPVVLAQLALQALQPAPQLHLTQHAPQVII